MPGPLEGVRVIEFTEIIAGPVGGMLLADFGADVIKVEPPWGDPWRGSPGPSGPNESRGFIAVNRGKRSIRVDLTRPGGRAVVNKLVEDADVIVLNHRPDVPAKLGIDYETLSAVNPRIIYCEVTAYGRGGVGRGVLRHRLLLFGRLRVFLTQVPIQAKVVAETRDQFTAVELSFGSQIAAVK